MKLSTPCLVVIFFYIIKIVACDITILCVIRIFSSLMEEYMCVALVNGRQAHHVAGYLFLVSSVRSPDDGHQMSLLIDVLASLWSSLQASGHVSPAISAQVLATLQTMLWIARYSHITYITLSLLAVNFEDH